MINNMSDSSYDMRLNRKVLGRTLLAQAGRIVLPAVEHLSMTIHSAANPGEYRQPSVASSRWADLRVWLARVED
jgi:hypothetical protein